MAYHGLYVHTWAMPAVGNRDRILDALQRSGQPLDDDQLSELAGVRPRQQVNQICRALARDGLIHRYRGSNQKIVNNLVVAEREDAVNSVPQRPSGQPGQVFVSYSREDQTYVRALADHLDRAGIPVWFDHSLVPGEAWTRVIRDQIDRCTAFIVVMTPSAEASQWVERELTHAERLRKPLVPLLLKGEVFFRLNNLHYDDVTDRRMPAPGLLARLRMLANGEPPSTDAGMAAAQVSPLA